MSIPWCMRPQRQPNGLVIGPLTGQIRPADDGVGVGAVRAVLRLGGADRVADRALTPPGARRSPRPRRARTRRAARGPTSFCCLVDERSLRRADELIAHVARLRRAGRDHRGLALDARAQHLRLRARGCHLRASPSPTSCATCRSWLADLVHVLRPRRARPARCASRGRRRASRPGPTRRCRRAALERRDRRPVLLLEEREALRLEREERVQRVEALLVQREVGLERLQAERDVADLRLERADPRA